MGKKMCVRKIELKDGREIEVHLIEKDNGKYEIDMANGFSLDWHIGWQKLYIYKSW